MNNPFTPAKKVQSKLRLAVSGPSGSGKTWTALLLATELATLFKTKIAFIDTEGRSARKYGADFDFEVMDIANNYDPKVFIDGIRAASHFGYGILIIDSLTHAWNGSGGVLDIVDRAASKMGDNSWAGWSKGRPAQNNLVDAIINAPIHLIGTMRTKTEWVQIPNPKNPSKMMPSKVGLAAIQSADFEYEFDLAFQIDMEHVINVSKSRCRSLPVNSDWNDSKKVAKLLHDWLTDGEQAPPQPSPAQEQPATTPQATPAQQPPAPPPYAGTWYADDDQRGKFLSWLSIENFTAEDFFALTGKRAYEYPTSREAAEAFLAAKKAPTPKAAQYPDPAPTQDTAPPDDSDEDDDLPEDDAIAAACALYGVEPLDMLAIFKRMDWKAFGTPQQAVAAIHDHANTAQMPFIASVIKLGATDNGGKYMEFLAPGKIGKIKLYGRRETLVELLGEQQANDFINLYSVDEWEVGKTYHVHDLRVSWQKDGKLGSSGKKIVGLTWQNPNVTTTEDEAQMLAEVQASVDAAEAEAAAEFAAKEAAAKAEAEFDAIPSLGQGG